MKRFDAARPPLVGCLLAAALVAAPGAAHAAVPRTGAWESAGNSLPRVSFDVVRGAAGGRIVQLVSFPIVCAGDPPTDGWLSIDTFVRVPRDGRFAIDGGEWRLRGRFTARDRADVVVHDTTGDFCAGTRRFAVRALGRRIPVRTGRYLSLVGESAQMGLDVSAFGRQVIVELIQGTVPSHCTDGSQPPLTLAGPPDYALDAPIRPSGRFDDVWAAAGVRIAISGSFDRGAVAAFVDLSVTRPDGVRCTAVTQPLVGALAFPISSYGGESGVMPFEPVVMPPGT
jgi:hypothetical protein